MLLQLGELLLQAEGVLNLLVGLRLQFLQLLQLFTLLLGTLQLLVCSINLSLTCKFNLFNLRVVVVLECLQIAVKLLLFAQVVHLQLGDSVLQLLNGGLVVL